MCNSDTLLATNSGFTGKYNDADKPADCFCIVDVSGSVTVMPAVPPFVELASVVAAVPTPSGDNCDSTLPEEPPTPARGGGILHTLALYRLAPCAAKQSKL